MVFELRPSGSSSFHFLTCQYVQVTEVTHKAETAACIISDKGQTAWYTLEEARCTLDCHTNFKY